MTPKRKKKKTRLEIYVYMKGVGRSFKGFLF